MRQRKLLLLLMVAAALLTGCVEAMVNAQMNRHLTKPDLSKIGPGQSTDADLSFYYNVLLDYENYFSGLAGRPLNAAEREEDIKRIEAATEQMVASSKKLEMDRMSAIRIIKDQVKQTKDNFDNTFIPQTLPKGAAWGRVLTKTEAAVPSIGAIFDKAYAIFYYPTETDEEANQLRRELFEKIGALGFANADWTITDISLNGYGQPLPEMDWPKDYKYWWSSPYKDKNNKNTAKTDQLVLMFSVIKGNKEFAPAAVVIAQVIINKEYQ